MAARKRIAGADQAGRWLPGYRSNELEMRYPLEVAGELRGAQLMIIGFPHEPELKFRLGILFPAMISRLDYTDETHVNSLDAAAWGVPPAVTGPHYHSWRVNRRFFRGVTIPPRLHDAIAYQQPGRSFEAILRWYCSDTGIDQPSRNHAIGLPSRESLF